VNAIEASKRSLRKPTRRQSGEVRHRGGRRAIRATHGSAGAGTDAERWSTLACLHKEIDRNTGDPRQCGAKPATETPRGADPAAEEVGEAHSSEEAG
jgi:hypothetical protein